MSRVLVTGGAGFIGSHVVDRLRAAGHQPRILDVRPSPYHDDVDTFIGDIRRLDDVRRALAGCDAVCHLAAAADVNVVAKEPAAAEELNARGTLNVLDAAREAGVKRVVYASTIWVYSDVEGDHADEETPLRAPAHLYTATKLAGELYCRSYAELYGLEPTILRFGIPYGPRARPAAVVPAFVGKALAGEALTIAGTGEQCRRFVYVEDLAEGVVRGLAPEAANRTYNLVSDEDVSIRRIAETVQEVVRAVPIVHTEGRAGDFKGVEVSGVRAAAELGWHPETPFREGVRRYVDWHVAHDPAPAPARERVRRPVLATLVAATAAVVAGVLAAGLAHVEAFTDPAGVVAALALLGVPVALVSGLDWARDRRRAALVVGALLLGAALATVLESSVDFVFHAAREHRMVALMIGAASAVALTGVGRLRAERG